MNNIGGGWMGGNGWGWATSSNATTIVYPSYVVTDATVANGPPPKPRSRTPLEWLRDQIEEITEAAIA